MSVIKYVLWQPNKKVKEPKKKKNWHWIKVSDRLLDSHSI